ncbi:hypothetical protein V8D89_008514, partial [Ganoderma adspersum]
GEFKHRRAKRFYARTNKNSNFGLQIGLEVRRAAVLNRISKAQAQDPQLRKRGRAKTRAHKGRRLQLRFQDVQPLPPTQPDQHHHISCEARYPVSLADFIHENEGDAACENFERDLKAHLLRRLPGGHVLPPDYVPTNDELFTVRIVADRMYQHKVLRVNYTRYDMRRDQDSVNPRTHPDIMMLVPDDATHPYLYARVIGMFHVMAYRTGDDLEGNDDTEPELIHVLWVRWFDLDPRAPGGFKARRLPRLRWASLDDDAFGFLSPAQVLRAVHLMPAFAHGQSDRALPGFSVARRDDEDDTDWDYHYVGIFVDRDMLMRYRGGAVGHQHGKAGQPQPPPMGPEPIPEAAYDVDDDEGDDPPGIGGLAATVGGFGRENDDSESGDDGSQEGGSKDRDDSEAEVQSSGEDDEDDGALGPEDGEVAMGEDEAELAELGFAPM